MPNDQNNVAETTLDLCHLMRDLEILGFELIVAEEAVGHQPACTHQAPLLDRLMRVGVNKQEVESFNAWRQTLSGLAGSNSRDEDHLAKIAATEKVGLILLAELIQCLRTRNRQKNASNIQVEALAA